MPDPFQDVDAAGPAFVAMFADAMDLRQSDPTMEAIVADYLGRLAPSDGDRVIEVGAGAGAVTRRIAAFAPGATVIGYEPSEGFVAEARARGRDHANLTFERADGTALPVADGAVDAAVLHTVLTRDPEPARLIAEAARVLRPGARLAICDSDFSKATMSGGPNDPLDACARAFVSDFVTDPFVVSKLRGLVAGAGLALESFAFRTRLVTDGPQMRSWVDATTRTMVERGEIGAALAEALLAEHDRRVAAGTLYGYQPFVTAVARKPG